MLNLDIVSLNRNGNVQSVFQRRKSRAEFCLVIPLVRLLRCAEFNFKEQTETHWMINLLLEVTVNLLQAIILETMIF